ncbi:hypothetical protein S40285_10951 [Stachybotrys chlorohalonatus IBT 40285]|uniref:Uncharacterized protein n=1 Tax=Stachybotrys chlorohalonatus (strain IBT 40285) TaxID=1283841 RepID=A0A084Q8A3_STAC4|nr:hypothetical protein S40285_10951 [Stachybotrys chlorohalonata IBT 40285]
MSLLKSFNQRVLDGYLGQLYLSTIYCMLYSSDNPEQVVNDKLKYMDSTSGAVSDMKWLPSSFVFKEDDESADSILEAQLRAKY